MGGCDTLSQQQRKRTPSFMMIDHVIHHVMRNEANGDQSGSKAPHSFPGSDRSAAPGTDATAALTTVTNITSAVVLVVHCRNSEDSGIPPCKQTRYTRILLRTGAVSASTPIRALRVVVPPEAARDLNVRPQP
ncbi:hypothetical protein FSPOR_1393 [Fusarium sporotrichioides]|uniref:Uncharacterized protein n=1 Tax=Fusarium sporotrichioides TaxID=5514 RepID=A0A395SPK1_FUSSP|nr:hypothetical protein FSPOR_1393 [Fusarium sporotrichioides]